MIEAKPQSGRWVVTGSEEDPKTGARIFYGRFDPEAIPILELLKERRIRRADHDKEIKLRK